VTKSDRISDAPPAYLDEAVAQIARIDAHAESIIYLDQFGQQANRTFASVQQVGDSIQSVPELPPPAIADRLQREVIPELRAALGCAGALKLNDAALAGLHRLVTQALEEDVSAFEHLVIAYRYQRSDQLAVGRSLRESSAAYRRDWLRRALALGRSIGLYDGATDPSPAPDRSPHSAR
jgi:hypothetical protein